MLPSFFGRYEGLTGLYEVTSVFGGGLSLSERIATPIFSKTRKLAILWGGKIGATSGLRFLGDYIGALGLLSGSLRHSILLWFCEPSMCSRHLNQMFATVLGSFLMLVPTRSSASPFKDCSNCMDLQRNKMMLTSRSCRQEPYEP